MTNKLNTNDCSEWNIVESKFHIESNAHYETLFSLGNGYIGMRGTFEEGYNGPDGTGIEGNYINGFYDSHVIKYGEVAYGYAKEGQTMLNVTNGKIIKVYLGEEELDLTKGTINEYERVLRLKEGILTRELIWTSPKGKKIKVESKRLVSFKHKNLAAINYSVTALNFEEEVKLVSVIDGNVTNMSTKDDPRVGSSFDGSVLTTEDINIEDSFGFVGQRTKNTKFKVICAMENEIETRNSYEIENNKLDNRVETIYKIQAKKDEKITLNKYISYVTSRDLKEEELIPRAKEVVKRAKIDKFERLLEDQINYLEEYWYKADVHIKGDEQLQQGLRFNMFHLLQSAGRDGKTNIAAKGLTGEGYEGHYFWDTEIYMLPFFLYHHPEISRKLLEYRYSILDKARERAREMAHPTGALFPWRTIAGEECSAYYPAGTAQYHINGDVALAIKRYMDTTEDTEFLLKYGAEMIFETARLWADLGTFIEKKGFCINGVTGPDEYTAIVNNNIYTNLIAKVNLSYANEVATWIKENEPKAYEELAKKIDLKGGELELFKRAADEMYVPCDKERGLYAQDDNFFERGVWDFENTPKEKYPLLLHFHPLVIYRHQVCKQADLVLALFLLGENFTLEEKKKNYDYYEKITTHDSSLSTCIFSIMASEIGYHEKAYDYFMKTARMDLDDHKGNTTHGVHAANMAGTWMSVVNGFGGLRVFGDNISFKPCLPKKWDEYDFKVIHKGRLIHVLINKNGTTYRLLEGEDITIKHYDRHILLKAKGEVKIGIGEN
ncbi:glycoside hydrolase family 65 protein [Anaeromicrobium sediminis]|uniref:Family 65 glycosyl hydrolase n=1 Tax=Anaeromicrobium sediminis TaxID=1478221 RepID=A0A267MMY5_9FIRM|nr:glycosyl hydrolase family 65 protein [Anaeromicrobium sediminis]PAB60288.1 family 65 glycosyl hydrolase [Anaeromicrobium sediminis]